MYRDKSCIFLLLFLDPQKKKGLVCYNLPLQSYRISAPWFCGLSNLEHGLQLELPQLSSSVMLMVWIRESESELHSTWCCLLDQSAKDRERLISGRAYLTHPLRDPAYGIDLQGIMRDQLWPEVVWYFHELRSACRVSLIGALVKICNSPLPIICWNQVQDYASHEGGQSPCVN